jgi:hypothetical protein
MSIIVEPESEDLRIFQKVQNVTTEYELPKWPKDDPKWKFVKIVDGKFVGYSPSHEFNSLLLLPWPGFDTTPGIEQLFDFFKTLDKLLNRDFSLFGLFDNIFFEEFNRLFGFHIYKQTNETNEKMNSVQMSYDFFDLLDDFVWQVKMINISRATKLMVRLGRRGWDSIGQESASKKGTKVAELFIENVVTLIKKSKMPLEQAYFNTFFKNIDIFARNENWKRGIDGARAAFVESDLIIPNVNCKE